MECEVSASPQRLSSYSDTQIGRGDTERRVTVEVEDDSSVSLTESRSSDVILVRNRDSCTTNELHLTRHKKGTHRRNRSQVETSSRLLDSLHASRGVAATTNVNVVTNSMLSVSGRRADVRMTRSSSEHKFSTETIVHDVTHIRAQSRDDDDLDRDCVDALPCDDDAALDDVTAWKTTTNDVAPLINNNVHAKPPQVACVCW